MEKRLNVTKDIQAKVFELYSLGMEQKEIGKLLNLQPKVVSHYFILFTATFTDKFETRLGQIKNIEKRLFEEIEKDPNSNNSKHLQNIYSQYLLVK